MKKLKFTIKNTSTTLNKSISKVDVKITKNDNSYVIEEHELNVTLAPSQTTTFYSSLEESAVVGVQKSNINIHYNDEEI